MNDYGRSTFKELNDMSGVDIFNGEIQDNTFKNGVWYYSTIFRFVFVKLRIK